jgi:fructokinase
VVDTVGAGDSFMGGLLHVLDVQGLTGSAGRAGLYRMTVAEASAILAFAARVAAVPVSRAGADPPWLGEVPGDFDVAQSKG